MAQEYTLIAGGRIAKPTIYAAIHHPDEAKAIKQATLIVAELSLAGYSHFWLVDKSNNKDVGVFTSVIPEPVVTFIAKAAVPQG